MKPSEAVAAGRALENRARQEGRPEGLKLRDLVAPQVGMTPSRYAHAKAVVCAAESEDNPKVREAAERALGLMDRTGSVETAYRQLRAAKEAAEAEAVQAEGDEAYRAMGVRQRRAHDRRVEVARLHGLGYTTQQVATKLGVHIGTVQADVTALGLNRRHGQATGPSVEIVRRAVVEMRGMASVLEGVDLDHLTPDADEAARWAGDLGRVLKALRRIHTHVKDRSQQ